MNIYEYMNSFVCMHHIFSIHPSSSFLNNTVVDMGLQVRVCQDMESLGVFTQKCYSWILW